MVGGRTGVGGPGVGAQQLCVAALGPEGGAADQDGDADGLAGGDRGVRGGQPSGDRAGERDHVRPGAVEMPDEVRGRNLGAEVVDLPATQLQDFGQQAGRQPVPFAVHTGHCDPAPGDRGAGGGVRAHRGHGPFVDGGRRVLLGDTDPVGCPFLTDPALHLGDHIQQDALRIGPLVEQTQYEFGGRVLVRSGDGLPQQLRGLLRVSGAREARRGAGAHGVNLPLVCPFTALRWWVRGAEITTTAMSS